MMITIRKSVVPDNCRDPVLARQNLDERGWFEASISGPWDRDHDYFYGRTEEEALGKALEWLRELRDETDELVAWAASQGVKPFVQSE